MVVWATSDPKFQVRESKVEYAKAYETCSVRDDYMTCSTIKSMEMMVYEPVCGGTNGCPANTTAQERGAVVIIHGGGFAKGDFCGCVTVTAAKFFASRGLTAVTVSYRLDPGQGLAPKAGVAFAADYVNEHVPPPDDGAYYPKPLPAMYAALRDTRAAVRYVRAAMGYEWIAVAGFSAGS
jgi:acetyl esterase/lipase